MAYPTGTGSEILARTTIHAQSNVTTAFRFDGTMATTGTSTGVDYDVPALHIITVLSIIITEQGGAAETFGFYMNDGGRNIQLLESQAIGVYGTFVWNDRFVIKGGDFLYANLANTGNVDFLCTYIDQDWTT